MLKVLFRRWRAAMVGLLLVPIMSSAQTPPQLPPGLQLQLQMQQPPADVSVPTSSTASFDAPVTRPGETVYYRVSVEATEASVQLPEKIPAPLALMLKPVAQGQILQFSNGQPRPLTTFLFEATPTTAGRFVIPGFSLKVFGQSVPVPAAGIIAVDGSFVPTNAPRRLVLETTATNVYLGEPFRVRVLLPASAGNQIEALRETQINSDGFITDKTSVRQSVETVNYQNQLRPAYIYEATLTPIAVGRMELSAQAFTAGREFTGPITITGQVIIPGGQPTYNLLVSGQLEINVRPLPSEKELPGFTGAIGKFFCDPPQLSTNRLRVGEPVQLKSAIHAADNLSRPVPPATPRSKDWLIIANEPAGSGYTLVPLTDEVEVTPAIPFCYFDPESGQYKNLSIPALPVTVTGGDLPLQVQTMGGPDESAAPLKLSALTTERGKTVDSFRPLQLRAWFIGVQLLPVLAFVGLWRWDCNRRFLEAHPEIVRRRRAKRDLRREKRRWQKAVAAGDAAAFVRHAVDSLKIACAPHFPAHPQALVCGDVLAQLDAADQTGRAGDTVRKLFAIADEQFAVSPQQQEDLLALDPDAAAALQKLEEKL